MPSLAVRMLAGLFVVSASSLAQDAPRRPNILFVFSDDHAPPAIGAYGGPLAAVDPTPHIDALAEQGVLFRNSFCTNSICGPSRAVVLTGKHSHRNGFMQNGDRFDGDQVTFPKLLQAAGYATAVIGKWHLDSDPQGFDHWEVLPGQGDYYDPEFVSADGRRRLDGYVSDLVTDLSLEWLESVRADGRPWLLMAQHKGPHRNWMPAPRHLDLYDDVELPEPATLFDDWADNASPARHQQMTVEHELDLVYDLFVPPHDGWDREAVRAPDGSGFRNLARMAPEQRAVWDAAFADENAAFLAAGLQGEALVRWKYQRYLKNYLRTVRGVDDSVGRLLRWLDETGQARDTLVIYSSDQGFFLGDHGWYDKRWMYDESLAMPLIARWPGVIAPGREVDALVQNLDHAPTLLELAGVSVPDDMQGRSLAPWLRGEGADDWRDAIYYHYYGYPAIHRVARHDGIRTHAHKLIRFYQTGEWELYDLRADPDERHNVFADPAYRALATDLAERLGALRAEAGVPPFVEPAAVEVDAAAR